MKYIIREIQNAQSHRTGETIEAKNLADAKRTASRRQCFHGTVLVVEDQAGNRLAVKQDGRWADL